MELLTVAWALLSLTPKALLYCCAEADCENEMAAINSEATIIFFIFLFLVVVSFNISRSHTLLRRLEQYRDGRLDECQLHNEI